MAPPRPPTHSTEFQWKFPPREFPCDARDKNWDESDNDEDDSSYTSSSSDESSPQLLSTKDDDDDDSSSSSFDGEEPPHPLGFESHGYGRTRFGLSPLALGWRNVPRNRNYDDNAWDAPVRVTPLRSELSWNHLYHDGISRVALFRDMDDSQTRRARRTMGEDDMTDGMDRIANLLRAATVNDTTTPSSASASTTTIVPYDNSKLIQLAQACEHHLRHELPHQMSRLASDRSKSYQSAIDGLMALLHADADQVAQAEQRIHARSKQREKEREDAQLEIKRREEQEELARQEEREARRIRLQRDEEARRMREEEDLARLEQLKRAEEEAVQEAQLKNAHVARAKEIVTKLDRLRTRLGEFDASKTVSKRRLAFKKIVNGKINTLSHDENKIKEVAALVVEAIQAAGRDDEQSSEEVSKLGRHYLVDLLASNLIVRVQADGFNGTRGDGFPLAACFAMVSTQCEELTDVLEGHLYVVCPMGVPVLEMQLEGSEVEQSDRSDEEKWMESLGMVREKSGEFESFDKFLHRTEGLISIMANIMSSLPSDHTLLGGHEGALTWLERFLELLPPPPTQPLPLLTAPVLVAFLTGAGHMLANKFSTNFKPLFQTIEKVVMNRLDDSPVGVPSATRLKKVMDGGFEGLKKNMPPGAVESLYDGKEGSGTASVALPPTGSSQGAFGRPTHTMNSSPFGQTASNSSPFGQPASSSSAFGQTGSSSSPFGQTGSSSTPFGQTGSGNASPFASSMSDSQPPSSFGQTVSANTSPFGTSMMDGDEGTQNSSWGSNAGTGSNPFSSSNLGTSSFGASTTPSSFASPQTQAAPSGAFGGQSNPFQSQSNPFGGGSKATPSPFGGQPTASPFGAPSNPFGGTTTTSAPAPSPFGAFSSQPQSNNPFGGGTFSSGSTSFGSGNSDNVKKDTRPPCKFFAKGSCRYGANCKFSHGDAAPTGGTNESFSSFGSSFGAGGNTGGGVPAPSPFGGGTGFGGSGFGTASPFSSNAQSNPFGGPRR
ncbi:hypothetical protein HJC23_002611 [Cyclotella cryptica]|uniref:mRNA export factor GLE1 n=1 Tax=Cyclotella cryptica TaxID=29204 RepID=A0ABD3PXC0_9STRA